jgi:hypothetical protein
VIDPAEYVDVTIAHPWVTVDMPLTTWIRTGPGARPQLEISAATRRSTGAAVPLSAIPLEYHNCWRARELQRRGELRAPWGPPPEPDPAPPEVPAHLRDLISHADC